MHSQKQNLKRARYQDVTLILGDGCLGYLSKAPFDAISITAASPDFPSPLINQLKAPGRMIAPIGKTSIYEQDLSCSRKRSRRSFIPKSIDESLLRPTCWEVWFNTEVEGF